MVCFVAGDSSGKRRGFIQQRQLFQPPVPSLHLSCYAAGVRPSCHPGISVAAISPTIYVRRRLSRRSRNAFALNLNVARRHYDA